jgi:hypothetical protein
VAPPASDLERTVNDIIENKERRPPAKRPRISGRMRQALDLYISGAAKTQQEAAEKAGISPEHLCRTLKKDHARAYVVRRSGEMFADLLPKAIRTIGLTMDGGNAQAALNAALAVARQMGIVSAEGGPSVAITLQAPGYVIDLSATASPIIEGHAQDISGLPDVRQLPPAGGPADDVDSDDDGSAE